MDGKRKGFLIALVIGLLAGPALALGATQVFGSEPAAAAPPASATLTAGLPTSSSADDAAPDLARACGPEAATLRAGEAAGTLSDVQQAALDALRPICAAAGFRLNEAASAADEMTSPTQTSPGTVVAGGTSPVSYGDYDPEDDEAEPGEYEPGDHGDDEYGDEFEGSEVEGGD